MSGLTPNTVPDHKNVVITNLLPDYSAYLHVAAAVIEDGAGHVLLARRPSHLHQGGLWEFPGGKVEAGESVYEALTRELQEELGIQVTEARPLIRIPYDYPDRKVLLDVWRVTGFDNIPHGAEGQQVAWVDKAELTHYAFPAANAPIVTAARLPHHYLITPEPGDPSQWPAFLACLELAITQGIRLLQFRATHLSEGLYSELAEEVIAVGKRLGAQILLNASLPIVAALHADGIHLNARRLMSMHDRPLDHQHWVAASCHNLAELEQAVKIGVDFVLISPVKSTATHPEVSAIGWSGFQVLSEQSRIPVFALGGMTEGDLHDAWQYGGQGIAAIRALWPDSLSTGGCV